MKIRRLFESGKKKKREGRKERRGKGKFD